MSAQSDESGDVLTHPEVRPHLLQHLTDGRWHDDCPLCLNRRRYGGDGVTSPPGKSTS